MHHPEARKRFSALSGRQGIPARVCRQTAGPTLRILIQQVWAEAETVCFYMFQGCRCRDYLWRTTGLDHLTSSETTGGTEASTA